MSEKSISFCWSTVSCHLEVFDQHRRGNAADVNLDRSECLFVLFTNINGTRRELHYVLGHPHFKQMSNARCYGCDQST